MLRKIGLSFLLVIVSILLTYASNRVYNTSLGAKPSLSERIYYGGTLGLAFGSYTRIGLYPMVAYKINPKLSAGVKIAYEYIKQTTSYAEYTSSNYGGSVFARYRVIPALYLHVEYETINYEFYPSIGESYRDWVPYLLVGGGYSQRTSQNTWVNAQLLFDVLNNENSPYKAGTPFFSVGVGVGF